MKYQNSGFLAVLLLVSIRGAPAIAAEDIDIPFHLARGQVLYEKYCSSCHGMQLDGTDKGPPLIHPFYKPSHHGDKSFYRAVLKGVKQHHWNFGNMEPVAGMTPKKMKSLVPYVRYYQQQKNLF